MKTPRPSGQWRPPPVQSLSTCHQSWLQLQGCTNIELLHHVPQPRCRMMPVTRVDRSRSVAHDVFFENPKASTLFRLASKAAQQGSRAHERGGHTASGAAPDFLSFANQEPAGSLRGGSVLTWLHPARLEWISLRAQQREVVSSRRAHSAQLKEIAKRGS